MSDEKEKKPKKGEGKEGGKPKGDDSTRRAAQAADKPAKARTPREHVPVRLAETYKTGVVPTMMKRFNYGNIMQVPRLEKISINIGVGEATQDAKLVEAAVRDLEAIVGQKVVITRAKKSISNFKLREKMPIGCRVTLRRGTMYEFLDRFISVTIPRIRDFRGLSDKSFDGRGNYTIGIKEHTVFPEIDVDKITRIFGMDITFVTTAKTDEEAYELLKAFGMPFVKRQEVIEPAKA
ncbi:MAG: Ribosomal protein [Bacteroidetes bacterium]|jgi:large subunit ribosomal protein L5|nr:Ribosomal protein [Bacteroidota bacterium]